MYLDDTIHDPSSLQDTFTSPEDMSTSTPPSCLCGGAFPCAGDHLTSTVPTVLAGHAPPSLGDDTRVDDGFDTAPLAGGFAPISSAEELGAESGGPVSHGPLGGASAVPTAGQWAWTNNTNTANTANFTTTPEIIHPTPVLHHHLAHYGVPTQGYNLLPLTPPPSIPSPTSSLGVQVSDTTPPPEPTPYEYTADPHPFWSPEDILLGVGQGLALDAKIYGMGDELDIGFDST